MKDQDSILDEKREFNVDEEQKRQLEDTGFIISGGYKVKPGPYIPYGVQVTGRGVSFTIHSSMATACELVLFHPDEKDPFAVIPFPQIFRVGNVYSMVVYGIEPETTEYAYRMDGPYDEEKGLIFKKDELLLDPYAKMVADQHIWGQNKAFDVNNGYRGCIVFNRFNWGFYSNVGLDFKDLVIYEMHVRGFTIDGSSNVKNEHRGTFSGIKEKIPYLKDLGVNAVELIPIFEFDELADKRMYEGEQLLDYWGYNTVCYFSPNFSYAATNNYNEVPDEFRSLVRELHKNGIEVILDVVFNHTAEGNEYGPYISFKGMDNQIYYMLTPNGKYFNFSGCGNTLNCNNTVVNDMVIDCLRYWVITYRIDGFRFDLASILGRSEDGTPMMKPPVLERVAQDPILSSVKLIAEAWDAGGMYQVGSFPSFGRWAEWNGKYRDDVRKFIKGDGGLRYDICNRLQGSRDIYGHYKQSSSNVTVNFITCHDGFSLYDLYSYNEKHNMNNGWNNTDGDNNNLSWNCGVEGDTDDPYVISLRKKLIKNAVTFLMFSAGAAMLRMGDEFCKTQYGNNNAYCQDNKISWIDWSYLEKFKDIYDYFKAVINFRREHPILRHNSKRVRAYLPDFYMVGGRSNSFDDYDDERCMGAFFAGRNNDDTKDDYVFLAMNMHWERHSVKFPDFLNTNWIEVFDTGREDSIISEMNVHDVQCELEPRSMRIFIQK